MRREKKTAFQESFGTDSSGPGPEIWIPMEHSTSVGQASHDEGLLDPSQEMLARVVRVSKTIAVTQSKPRVIETVNNTKQNV